MILFWCLFLAPTSANSLRSFDDCARFAVIDSIGPVKKWTRTVPRAFTATFTICVHPIGIDTFYERKIECKLLFCHYKHEIPMSINEWKMLPWTVQKKKSKFLIINWTNKRDCHTSVIFSHSPICVSFLDGARRTEKTHMNWIHTQTQ